MRQDRTISPVRLLPEWAKALSGSNEAEHSARNYNDVIEATEAHLAARTHRAPDREREVRALLALADEMAERPHNVLQKLCELVLDMCDAGTAGVSLLQGEGETADFYWPAIAGAWSPYIGGVMPRYESPCGAVIQTNSVLMFQNATEIFPAAGQAQPAITEILLAPFHQHGEPIGTVWAIAHDGMRRFDQEDKRVLVNLARFAAAAYQTTRTFQEAREAENTLRDSEARFRQFSDASTNVLWIRDAATLRMTFASPAFKTIYGRSCDGPQHDDTLRCWAKMIVPEDRKRVLDNIRRVRAGERVQHEFRIRRFSDGAPRWVHNADFPMQDGKGRTRWVAGLGADITEAKEAAERQGLLVGELQHRTRNLIGVVRSISERTIDSASSVEDFGQRFDVRLAALSRVQGLLSHLSAGEKIAFDELLRSELAAHGATDDMADKVSLDGPSGVPLRSSTVQTFALALHELATNAVKYGALAGANPDGHLAVRWRVEPATDRASPRFQVEWRESGVVMPPVDAPPRGSGFGRELIERALPYQLKAKTSYELGEDGVRCTIIVPLGTV